VIKKAVFLLQALVLYIFTLPIALMPLRIAQKIGSMLGTVIFFLWHSRRKIGIENVKRVISKGYLPKNTDPVLIVKQTFQNLGRSLVEVIKVYHGRGEEVFSNINIEGLEHLRQAQKKNRGILFITGHCGNWELLALTASYRVVPLKVVARRINNPYINALVERVRKSYGNSVIYKHGAIRQILTTLKENKAVGILIDQSVIPSEGILIDFLGSPAWSTKAPVLIAKKTGTPVLPVFIQRNGKGHIIKIYPEIEILQNRMHQDSFVTAVSVLHSYVERYVMENPSEWLWIHRRWKKRQIH
jgi:KDO2-lipid IV(A) lauroyltransferase